MKLCDFGVMLDVGFTKMFSAAVLETYFYYKYKWSAATDYYVNLYLTVLTPLTGRLQLRKFYSFITFHLLINHCFDTFSLHTSLLSYLFFPAS